MTAAAIAAGLDVTTTTAGGTTHVLTKAGKAVAAVKEAIGTWVVGFNWPTPPTSFPTEAEALAFAVAEVTA